MTRTEFIQCLRDLDACDQALTWIEQTPGEPADLWAACQYSDWILWLLAAIDYDEQTMRHIACDFAADVLPIYEKKYPNDPRPRDCIAVTRRYADGAVTYDELLAASHAAIRAARATTKTTAKAAAWAAASAASWTAASAAAWAASWAADVNAARAAAMSRQADMIRARVSWADVERAMECIAYKKE